MEELHSLPAYYFILPAVEKLGSSKGKKRKNSFQLLQLLIPLRVSNK